MESYIINTSIGFVSDNKGDTFIEIGGDIERNEEINDNGNFLMRKIRNLFKIRKSNKIDAEEFV
jgi:hypothetical protein